MAVTKRQAQQAFNQIVDQFKVFIDDEVYPVLIENWDYLDSGPTRWAVVWEGGPYEWALLAERGGKMIDYHPSPEIPAAKHWPAGTFAEPVTSWAVGIYEV